MRKVLHRVFNILIILLLEFLIYIALGLYKISVGCRGITVDCYIPEAEFAKEVQVVVVVLALLTMAWLAIYLMFFVCKWLSKYMKNSRG